MTNRIWKLYKEVRSLRRKVKTLENDLAYSNRRFNTLYYEKTQQEKPYNTMSFILPNMYVLEREIGPVDMYSRPRVEYFSRKLSDGMKIKLFDDLAEQGYIRKTRDDGFGEVFEIKVVK